MKFSVTYQIVTEESAEQGEAAESGFIDKDLGLREAVNAVFGTRTLFVDGYSTIYDDRTLTVDNGMEFLTGRMRAGRSTVTVGLRTLLGQGCVAYWEIENEPVSR